MAPAVGVAVMTTLRFRLLTAALASALGVAVFAQQPAPAPVFTAQQAAAGRAAYDMNCSACHLADLGGSNEAPQLAGGNFMAAWGDRSPRDLIAYITTAMPPTNPGGLGQPANTNIAAYILQANGAVPGAQALTAQTATAILSVAMLQ